MTATPGAPPPAESSVRAARLASGELLRANVVVAAGTLLSRVTGFARYVLLAALLDDALADSYNVANNVPNMLYELVLGGVLTATLVPMFTRQAEHGDDESASAVVSTAFAATVVVAVVATLASPLVVDLLTIRSAGNPGVDVGQLRRVATYFAFWFVPQIAFYGITFLASALLNARRRFFAAAWSPVANNVIVLAALAVMARTIPEPRSLATAEADRSLRLWLAVPTTAGIVAMAVTLLPALARAGIRLRFRPSVHHPAVRRVVALSRWTAGYVVANQIALFVVTALTRPGSFGATSYQLAFLVLQLPVGLLAMSVATTFTPELARARHASDRPLFVRTFNAGLSALALVIVPASAGLIALARPLIAVVMAGGYSSSARIDVTSRALTGFAFGMFFLAAYLYVLRGFYAHDDTRSAFVVNLVENAVNVALALALVGRFGVPGLAWSFSIAYVVAFALALRALSWKVRGLPLAPVTRSFGRLALAGVACGEAAWLASRAFDLARWPGALAAVITGGVAGVAAYGAALWAIGAPELVTLARLARITRRGRTASA